MTLVLHAVRKIRMVSRKHHEMDVTDMGTGTDIKMQLQLTNYTIISPSEETGFGDHIIQHMISQSLHIMQGVGFLFFLLRFMILNLK